MSIRVQSALVCEDLRIDQAQKIIAIGILMPSLSILLGDADAGLKLHVLLIVDVLKTGEHQLRVRLKREGARTGPTRRMRVNFKAIAKGMPISTGPFSLNLQPGDTGFRLQLAQDERWRTVQRWSIDPAVGGT